MNLVLPIRIALIVGALATYCAPLTVHAQATSTEPVLSLSKGSGQAYPTRPGASGVIGAEAVARAPADGYTLLFGTAQIAVSTLLLNTKPFDLARDFAAVNLVSSAAQFMNVHPSTPTPNLRPLASILPGYESPNWSAMFAPAGTPAAIVNKLRAGIAAALKAQALRDFTAHTGADIAGSTPAEFAAYARNELARYAKVI